MFFEIMKNISRQSSKCSLRKVSFFKRNLFLLIEGKDFGNFNKRLWQKKLALSHTKEINVDRTKILSK